MSIIKKFKGFTMIEILVVISIIGFLSAAAFYSFNIARSRSRDTKRVSDVSSLTKAFEIYFNEHNSYPDAGGDEQCVNSTSLAVLAMINANILKSNVEDPIWTNKPSDINNHEAQGASSNFCYYYYAEPSTYVLSYYLETNSDAGNAGIHVVTEEGRH
jgi:prepilin-type N-terminal cleavage/methylation domain-containing protein